MQVLTWGYLFIPYLNHIAKMTEIEQPNKTPASLEIKVLTLNIWGISWPLSCANRLERVEAISNYLATGTDDYDFVFLQEVWSKEDFKLIATKVYQVLPYSHYFDSGFKGAGICILSRSPLKEAHFHRFTLNGYAHKINHGDWFDGKGIGICRAVRHGVSFLLVTTHLHAEYSHEDDEYLHHRVVQAYEASQLMRLVKHRDDILLFAGDLNATPKDISYRLIKWNAGFTDTFNDCSTKPEGSLGETCETPTNSYTSVERLIKKPSGNRIDYIFYRADASYQVTTRVYDQPLPLRVPNKDFSYSDHEAVRAILTIIPTKTDAVSRVTTTESQAQKYALQDAAAVCKQGLTRLNYNTRKYALLCFALIILQIVFLVVLTLERSSGILCFSIGLASIVLMIVLCYCLMMASTGYFEEYSSIMSAKLGIELQLEQMRANNAHIFEEENQHNKFE